MRLPAFRAEHFPFSGPYPWLDLPGAKESIRTKYLGDGTLTEEEAEQCRFWHENGYIILRDRVAPGLLDEVWADYERAIGSGKIQLPPEPAGEGDPWPGRMLNPHKKVPAFCKLLKHRAIAYWTSLLLGRKATPLQSIASHKGSQQAAHSDSIHMTTYPTGYLAAAWIAFEDIHPDCGPLVYYSGSHKLPYVFSSDMGITTEDFRREGYGPYRDRYEPRIRQLIEKHGLEPKYFHARKGDVLIWHANLLHGGSVRNDLQLSRKAMVCHYYARGAFVYHDLSATRSKQQYVATCLLR
jgi:hypothetical protein